jgi:hypothetical protein
MPFLFMLAIASSIFFLSTKYHKETYLLGEILQKNKQLQPFCMTSLVEFQTLYNGILYKNYSCRAVSFYTRENKSRSSTFIYTKHFARPLAKFCASEQSHERGQMPNRAGMFSRQIPAYAGLTSGQIPGGSPGGRGDDRSWN